MFDPNSAPAWRRIDRLLDRALDLDEAGRKAFLESIASSEPDLADELRRFLRAADTAGGPLDGDLSALLGPDFLESIEDSGQVDVAEGRFVGSYRIVAELARGGMGRVFRAERADGVFDQTVALKVLRWADATPDLRRRFRNERQILAQLQHPEIARLLDGGVTDDGVPYLVMEYVEGRAIDRYCWESDLGLDDRIRLFLRVCDAVQYAHSHLIVHRDLKPSNILVSHDGDVKLLDFGIAKFIDRNHRTLTRAGGGPLTPSYAAPEQLEGGAVSTTADVYALGVLLFELLTGGRPFEEDEPNPTELARRIVTEDPPLASATVNAGLRHGSASRPPRWAGRLSGDLDSILLKALRRAPEARYGSVDRLAEDLENYLNGRPVQARGGSRGYIALRFLRRHRTAVGSALVVVMSLAAGLAAALTQAHRASEEGVRARLAAARAEHVSTVLAGLFELADPYRAAAGGGLTVRDLLDQGVERAQGELSADTAVLAEVLDVVGFGYSRIGDFETARRHLMHALDLRRGLGDTTEIASSLLSLARFEATWGRDEATADYRRGLELVRAASDTATLLEARLLRGLMEFQVAQHEFEDATRLDAEASVIYSELLPPDDPRFLGYRAAHAGLLRARGDLDQAEAELGDIARIARGMDPPDLELLGPVLNNLAFSRSRNGDLQGASEAYAEALTTTSSSLGRGHPDAVRIAANLASTMQKLGRRDEAERLLIENVTATEPWSDSDPRRLLVPLQNLGGFYLLTADHEAAVPVWRRDLELLHALPGAGVTEIAVDQLKLALALQFSGGQDEATDLRRAAFRALGSGGPLNYFARNQMNWIADRYQAMGATALARDHRPAAPPSAPE